MLSADLSNKVNDYVAAVITLKELEEWLAPRLPYFLRSPDSADADIVSAIELGLAHIANDLSTEEQLRRDLQDELRLHTSIFYARPQKFQIDTTSVNATSPITGSVVRGWTSAMREMSISMTGVRP